MWYSKTRWIMAAILFLSIALANPFRPWSPQQRFYRELSDRHARLAAECRRREDQARARGDVVLADRLRKMALDHDRQFWMLRKGSYESDEVRTGNAWRP
jgi:hypothetical protein